MYSFKQLSEYPNIVGNKVPFIEKGWVEFLTSLKGVRPVYLVIINTEGQEVGFFVGGITKFYGIKVLGSPFWGWMGQHMGLALNAEVDKASLIDDLIDYAVKTLKVGYFQMCSFNVEFEDIQNCKHNLVTGEQYTTCYIDLTQDEAQLSKNLKSGYRTSIRKFVKDGGFIEEDYSEEFIEEHHRQLEQVFTKVGHKTPNYREKCIYSSIRLISLKVQMINWVFIASRPCCQLKKMERQSTKTLRPAIISTMAIWLCLQVMPLMGLICAVVPTRL